MNFFLITCSLPIELLSLFRDEQVKKNLCNSIGCVFGLAVLREL
jgi:hypothetical protein